MRRLYGSSILILSINILLSGIVRSQNTTVQLPTTADTNSSFRVLNNTGNPLMRLNSDGGFYFGGATMTGMIPATGGGTRLMWFPGKSAFRAGTVVNAQWNDINIGLYSMALGSNTIASGEYSTAIGDGATANGMYSTAIGHSTTSSGDASVAMGYATTAIGGASTAMGFLTAANSNMSTAMGSYVKSNHFGAFIIGDFSKSAYDSSSANNQITMRFAGGYRLYSSADLSTGVYMNAGINGWSNVCDRNKKENFCPIDGEQILTKIREMPITEWNYKGTDKSVKYIGPVAQDFYSTFHLGGTDSLGINSICIDGVNIAAIQALEKRTAELQKANEKIALIERQNIERDKIITNLTKKIEALSKLITSSTTKNN